MPSSVASGDVRICVPALQFFVAGLRIAFHLTASVQDFVVQGVEFTVSLAEQFPLVPEEREVTACDGRRFDFVVQSDDEVGDDGLLEHDAVGDVLEVAENLFGGVRAGETLGRIVPVVVGFHGSNLRRRAS